MKPYVLYRFFYFSMLFLSIACGKTTTSNPEDLATSTKLIQITQSQFNADQMTLGDLTMRSFDDVVTCTGIISSPPNGRAEMSSQLSGIVVSILCNPGEYVKKGQVLCTLTSNELIEMQQSLAEASAKLKAIKLEFERKKILSQEKIGADKDLIVIESEYDAMKAQHASLRMQLALLNLDVSKIESGELVETFSIKAAISGVISRHNVVLGQFVEQQKPMFEVVDMNQLQLQLSIFQKDIQRLSIPQTVRFKTMAGQGEVGLANLVTIGKTMQTQSNTIQCIAKIDKSAELHLISGAYLEAYILVASSECLSLPVNAILKAGKEQYVFVVDKKEDTNYYLRKEEVITGRTSEGFTEIVSPVSLKDVVTNGVYNLQTD